MDHESATFNFFVSQRVAARWTASALRITRRWNKVYALAWINLYDDPPNEAGNEFRGGLFDARGNPKPAFYSFKRG
jgi:hypothetical protein